MEVDEAETRLPSSVHTEEKKSPVTTTTRTTTTGTARTVRTTHVSPDKKFGRTAYTTDVSPSKRSGISFTTEVDEGEVRTEEEKAPDANHPATPPTNDGCVPHRTVNPWLKYWKANREDAASAAKSFEEKTRQVRLMAFISTVHLVFYMSIMIVDFSEGNGISTGVVAGLGVLTMIMILLSLISMCGHDVAAWLNYIRLAMVSEIVIITFHARLAYASFQHKVPDYSEPFISIALVITLATTAVNEILMRDTPLYHQVLIFIFQTMNILGLYGGLFEPELSTDVKNMFVASTTLNVVFYCCGPFFKEKKHRAGYMAFIDLVTNVPVIITLLATEEYKTGASAFVLLVNIAQAQYDMVFEVILSYHLVKEEKERELKFAHVLVSGLPALSHIATWTACMALGLASDSRDVWGVGLGCGVVSITLVFVVWPLVLHYLIVEKVGTENELIEASKLLYYPLSALNLIEALSTVIILTVVVYPWNYDCGRKDRGSFMVLLGFVLAFLMINVLIYSLHDALEKWRDPGHSKKKHLERVMMCYHRLVVWGFQLMDITGFVWSSIELAEEEWIGDFFVFAAITNIMVYLGTPLPVLRDRWHLIMGMVALDTTTNIPIIIAVCALGMTRGNPGVSFALVVNIFQAVYDVVAEPVITKLFIDQEEKFCGITLHAFRNHHNPNGPAHHDGLDWDASDTESADDDDDEERV